MVKKYVGFDFISVGSEPKVSLAIRQEGRLDVTQGTAKTNWNRRARLGIMRTVTYKDKVEPTSVSLPPLMTRVTSCHDMRKVLVPFAKE